MPKNRSNNDTPCVCCAVRMPNVPREPRPAVAARAVDHAVASAWGTKRIRPLSSTSLADGARLGRPALGIESGAGGGATGSSYQGSGLPASSCCGWSRMPPLLPASASSSSFSSSSSSLDDGSSSLLLSSALLSSASRGRAALVAIARHGRHHAMSSIRVQQMGRGCSGCLQELHAVALDVFLLP